MEEERQGSISSTNRTREMIDFANDLSDCQQMEQNSHGLEEIPSKDWVEP